MIALGIDVSSTKLAIAGIREDGSLTYHALALPAADRGARRLKAVRSTAWAVLDGYRATCPAVVVEIPWASSRSSFVLLSIAGVVMEAAQSAIPGAVVLELSTSSWKVDSVGHGNASKDDVMAHAAGFGYEGNDQDVADALCMAQCAWGRWNRATLDETAA